MNTNELKDLIMRKGAFKAEVIATEAISLSADFLQLCEMNSCGKYGRCYMCPPDIGDIEELMAAVRSYRSGVLYQTVSPLEDSFDYEGMVEAANKHNLLSHAIQDEVKALHSGRLLHLSKGGCGLCESCAKCEGKPCRFPEKALSSLEAYGINVSETVKATGMKYINGQNTVTYFGLVLISE